MIRFLPFIFISLITLSLSAGEFCTDDACYPLVQNVYQKNQELKIFSATDFNYLFYDVYSIALYLDEQTELDILDLQRSKILFFIYHRDIEKKRLVDGAVDTLKDNKEIPYSKYQELVESINDYYVDVSDGDSLELHYHPDRGISLIREGQELIHVEDNAFAQYYLGIWLGDYPLSKTVRRRLREQG